MIASGVKVPWNGHKKYVYSVFCLFWILSCPQIWSETKHLGLYASRPYQGCFFSAQIFEKKKSIGFEKITFTNNISIYSMKTDQKLIVKNTWDILECFTFLDILECSWNFMEHRFSKYCWLIWKNLTSSWDVCSPHVWQRQSAWMTRTFLG